MRSTPCSPTRPTSPRATARAPPEITRHEPPGALFAGEDGLDVIRRLVPAAADAGARLLAIEVGEGQAEAVARSCALAGFGDVVTRAATWPESSASWSAAMTRRVRGLHRRRRRRRLPADTVYGLACDPTSRKAVARLYALKGRPADKPAAVMFFWLERALAALPELGPRTRAALEALLPGAVTLLLPNPLAR